MRRVYAMVAAVIGLGSAMLVAQPVTMPATTSASTQPTIAHTTATQPATTRAATGPSTAATATARAERDEKRAVDAKHRAEQNRITAVLTSIASDADPFESELRTIGSKFGTDDITSVVDSSLPGFLSEIGPRLEENDRLLSPAPSLENLRGLENDWTQYGRTLDAWVDGLRRRDDFLKTGITRLNELTDEWRTRRRVARDAPTILDGDNQFNGEAITQLADRAKAVVTQAQTLLYNLNWEQTRETNLRVTMSAAQTRVRNALVAVQEAQRKARDRLLNQDSPALWSAMLHPSAQGNVAEQGRDTVSVQWQTLKTYVDRHRANFLLHVAGVLALAAGLIWLRRQTRQWAANDPQLNDATRVFQTPIATAITVSMALTPWMYPSAPRLFWGILGTGALLPTIMVLRPLIERSLRPLLYGLAGATFINLLLSVVAALPLVYRLLFLAQMGGAALFFIWFLRSRRGEPGNPEKPPLRKAAVVGTRFGLAVTVIAFAANVFGFVSLSRLMGSALLTSAYLGVLLDTSVHVIAALMLAASHIQPLSSLGMVQRHRPLLIRRMNLVVSLLALCVWGYFTLDALSIRTTLTADAEAIWAWPKDVDEVFPVATVKQSDAVAQQKAADDASANAATQPADSEAKAAAAKAQADAAKTQAELNAANADSSGTKAITSSLYIGGIILFGLTLAAAYYLSRLIAFLLDEDIYPRLHLARGIPYAISTLLRYVVLAIGFTLAISNLGYNTTNLTILVSAFSLGLGFGLQNIVNNFVSGLILLFERPVQVGDVIELDNVTGVVSRIGIRASVIRTPLAAEIIIPNGRLISDKVVNWTLSNRQRGVELAVTVAPGVEPQRLVQLLTSTAKALPMVAAYPPPQAYFTDFSGGGMKFEVRAWTNRFEDWSQVRSELAVAVNAMLAKEKIELK